ncbi:uncharacterized protein PAN0_009d3832 [Moesziomyces antarcticus]|uniref:Uncharacterized protein n=2 Tax=Pseudozyma antarctica TaxID=84753 RepID=A0A5C3FTE4_PSEA2|nr:uncharacterized protein PAN0_009d3832 [Moesziomyces antarcticus]GAK65614.1 hypothetical protein PAN0_009d3832 [Moesziomyces antarcticus]SPO46629.1 uncharacterized protein PSANT_04315 [Moesziomyces antarcticus]
MVGDGRHRRQVVVGGFPPCPGPVCASGTPIRPRARPGGVATHTSSGGVAGLQRPSATIAGFDARMAIRTAGARICHSPPLIRHYLARAWFQLRVHCDVRIRNLKGYRADTSKYRPSDRFVFRAIELTAKGAGEAEWTVSSTVPYRLIMAVDADNKVARAAVQSAKNQVLSVSMKQREET